MHYTRPASPVVNLTKRDMVPSEMRCVKRNFGIASWTVPAACHNTIFQVTGSPSALGALQPHFHLNVSAKRNLFPQPPFSFEWD